MSYLTLSQLASLEGGSLAPLICRVGSKRRFAELLDYIAPEHTKYVEAFVGSGAFFWRKEPSKSEVINDLDKDVVRTYRLIQDADTNLDNYPKNLKTKEQLKSFLKNGGNSKAAQLTKEIIRTCGGWMGKEVNQKTLNVQRDLNPFSKLKHVEDYKARMKGVKIESKDYGAIIKEHDSPTTFFFFDPPYENSSGFDYAEEETFDFERFARLVRGIKGKWLVTINDSPRIRKLFKGFELHGIVIKGHKAKRAGEPEGRVHIGSQDRPELLISNYKLPSDWRRYKGSYIL